MSDTITVINKLPSYRNSGAYGDLIYSLIIPYLVGKGDFYIAMGNLREVCRKLGYNVSDQWVDPIHRECFTDKQYDFITPLLEVQPYIHSVSKWYPGNSEETTYDLDDFRKVLFKRFEGNYLEGFLLAHQIPYSPEVVHATNWLTVPKPQTIAKTVIARTVRYRDRYNGDANHKELATKGEFDKNAVFLGSPEEHADYEKVVGMKIQHYKVKDALQYAQVIAGATQLVSNQTFAYSIAIGLGKNALLETQKTKPLEYNECYFARKNCYYF